MHIAMFVVSCFVFVTSFLTVFVADGSFAAGTLLIAWASGLVLATLSVINFFMVG